MVSGSHTASLYPLSVQKSAKESYNLHFDESQLVLNNVEQSEMNMQDDLKHLNIESLMGKNITYQVNIFFLLRSNNKDYILLRYLAICV